MLAPALLFAVAAAYATDFPTGQILDDVKCQGDATESYALYLPKAYTPERAWPVIFAFDPGARGRNGVERYQAAAEQYGYIVAGSNNSRNGQDDNPAVAALSHDVIARFHIDPKRIYTAGMSGGARVAMGVAVSSPEKIAGVIASSATYPDGVRRRSLRFPVFATAGTEDFNHLEMRRLDRDLTTPHHLEIFDGGHVWLSSELALQAVEWMEIQAMKYGVKARDARELDRILGKRLLIAGDKRDKAAFLALQSIATDFEGLTDVAAVAARVKDLSEDKNIRDALRRDLDEDAREARMLDEVVAAEERLDTGDSHAEALIELRSRWRLLSEQSMAADDSVERRLARRVLGALSAGPRTRDRDYLDIIREYRAVRGGRAGD
jgi:predicted esterase